MQPPVFLKSALSPISSSQPLTVTLTFAQSTDGKIAGKGGQQIKLSCDESMVMTHWLRTMHDAILVGIGTAINDNPQLNTRLLPPGNPSPQPVILDSTLRCPPDCKLLKNFANNSGKQPWIIAQSHAEHTYPDRVAALETAGARLFFLPAQDNNATNLLALTRLLAAQNIKSLMIEGGATVINSCLSSPELLTNIVITVAPTIIGDQGLSYSSRALGDSFEHHSTEKVGIDAVFCWRSTR